MKKLDPAVLVHLANSTHSSLSDITLFLDGPRDGTPVDPQWRKLADRKLKEVDGIMERTRAVKSRSSRRKFLANAGVLSAAGVIGPSLRLPLGTASYLEDQTVPDYTVRIRPSAVNIGNKYIVSAVTYNDQFPGPLLRFKEGQAVTVEIHNDTDTPEQLHWHGQFLSTNVDGAAEEGTPFIPAHGMRRITFTPHPAGFRFYHTHNRAVGLARRTVQRSSRTRVHRTKTQPGRI
jgi:hypothetical protein